MPSKQAGKWASFLGGANRVKPIQWQEPISFRNYFASQDPDRYKNFYPLLYTGLIVSILMMGVPLLRRSAADVDWAVSTAVAFGVGAMIVAVILFVAWINTKTSRFVVINPQGIFVKEMRGAAYVFTTWPWGQIDCCSFERMELGGLTYLVLSAHMADGAENYYGINIYESPRSVPVDDIQAAIRAHGCAVEWNC